MVKPFKTHNQQLTTLRKRGLSVPSRVKRELENENYYNVINGYKDLFLVTTPSNNRPITPETFIKGTDFYEIFALYKLDRRLRNTLLEYLLVFETHMKSRISYYFSEKYKEPHSYLYFKNYSNDPRKTNDIVSMVATMSKIIMNKQKNGPVRHYINTHNGVPFWVLINYLTIGNVSYLYQVLDDNVRMQIANSYSKKFKREYEHINIQPKDIESILKQANFFRNVCAHEERLYDYKIFNKPNSKNMLAEYNRVFSKNFVYNNLESKLFDIVMFLKLFLNKKDFKTLCKELDAHIEYYGKELNVIKKSDIYNKMGCLTNDFCELL
ncbi:Abi family protein [Mammaliicoccus sciuri]|uniref:Abi family protein n=1 Tax=Mammaliicoccus sciuri TaxID=1296 RepID=UPI001FB2D4DD|nr:Abi family protein [Mammaliicoccus sciuri]MCJ0908818.1 Abi family protein [Mammaliicoccus sciuri]